MDWTLSRLGQLFASGLISRLPRKYHPPVAVARRTSCGADMMDGRPRRFLPPGLRCTR